MSTYDWYQICNVTEFQEMELPSQEFELNLEGLGLKSILVTRGNAIGVVFQDIYLHANINDRNPYEFEDHAVYIDGDNNLWVGILNED
jgi:hypothetical protein